MEFLPIILAILLVDLLALVSPGPNFVLVVSSAVSKSRRDALLTGCGIATGSFMWASAAALGAASILDALPRVGLALKIAGIVYLMYLGVRLLRSQGFTPSPDHSNQKDHGLDGFWQGFFVNMTNPKSAAYYASVFAAFLTPEMPVWVLWVLILSISAMSLIWHAFLAIGLSTAAVRARYIKVSKHVDRLCGGVLICLGLRLAWDSR